jgi:hypothetical protein
MPDEATQKMINRHEFRRFEHRFGKVRVRCYCGATTRLYLSEATAQTEHKRHQSLALNTPVQGRTPGGMK